MRQPSKVHHLIGGHRRSGGPDVRANRLLALLSPQDFKALRRHLKPVTLEYRRPLYEANKPIDSVYFVESGVASLVNTMSDGKAAEVGTIGNEGVVGLPILLGDSAAPTNVYVQVPGTALRMRAKPFGTEVQRSRSLRTIMLHYAHAFFNQVAQSAACNHFHSLEQRCCRWVLMTRERMPSDEFLLTQEFLGMMLGVQRTSVTLAMSGLQRDRLLRYSRGRVSVLNRRALEARSCECYSVTKAEFDRLLGGRRTRA
jgi:CRP-like cAMP-binding protein